LSTIIKSFINFSIRFKLSIFFLIFISSVLFKWQNSSFFIENMIGWDLQVYFCGTKLWLQELNPYDTNILRSCLADNLPYFYNFPPFVLYIFIPIYNVDFNIFWLVLNSINLFLIFKISIIFINRIDMSFFQALLFVSSLLMIFSSGILVSMVSGNLGFLISLITIYLFLKYSENNNSFFFYYIVLISLYKPLYICYLIIIFLKKDSYLSCFIEFAKYFTTYLIFSFFLYYLMNYEYNLYFTNLALLFESEDKGFGILQFFNNKNVNDFFQLLIIFILNLSLLFFLKRRFKLINFTFEEIIILIPIIVQIFFPRIKIYEVTFSVFSLCAFPIFLYKRKFNFKYILIIIISIFLPFYLTDNLEHPIFIVTVVLPLIFVIKYLYDLSNDKMFYT